MNITQVYASILAVVGVLVFASPASAGAAYVTATVDYYYMQVIGTAVTDTFYAMGGQHTAYATIAVTSPTGRHSELTAHQAPSAAQRLWMDISAEDGTFFVENRNPREYCPVGQTWYAVQTPSPAQPTVVRYVQLVRTAKAGSQDPVPKQDGEAKFQAYVVASMNCGGNVTVLAQLSPPGGMAITIGPNNGRSEKLVSPGGSGTEFAYDIHTEHANVITGIVSATANIYSAPAGCTVMAPGGGQTNTQTYDVR